MSVVGRFNIISVPVQFRNPPETTGDERRAPMLPLRRATFHYCDIERRREVVKRNFGAHVAFYAVGGIAAACFVSETDKGNFPQIFMIGMGASYLISMFYAYVNRQTVYHNPLRERGVFHYEIREPFVIPQIICPDEEVESMISCKENPLGSYHIICPFRLQKGLKTGLDEMRTTTLALSSLFSGYLCSRVSPSQGMQMSVSTSLFLYGASFLTYALGRGCYHDEANQTPIKRKLSLASSSLGAISGFVAGKAIFSFFPSQYRWEAKVISALAGAILGFRSMKSGYRDGKIGLHCHLW
jgi:hypothetical protein